MSYKPASLYTSVLVVFLSLALSAAGLAQEPEVPVSPVTDLSSARPSLLDGVVLAAPLTADTVLCALSEGAFTVVQLPSGELTPWQPGWTPASDGWERGGEVLALAASPAGQWICFAQRVYLPGAAELQGNLFEPAEAVAVVVCRPDGSEGRAVALGYTHDEWDAAGPEIQYDFTQDSARLVGHPFHPCLPDAEHYLQYASALWEYPPIDFFNYIDLATGERGAVDDLDLYQGYWKCPYSDYFISAAYTPEYPHFGNLQESGWTGVYITAEGMPGHALGWVLPDAVLYTEDLWQGLLYVDGEIRGQEDAKWRVYCWLPDGTYIFSDDGGATIKYGKVDWGTFSVDWWVDQPDLAPYLDGQLLPLPDSSGLLVITGDERSLRYIPLSREGAKP